MNNSSLKEDEKVKEPAITISMFELVFVICKNLSLNSRESNS